MSTAPGIIVSDVYRLTGIIRMPSGYRRTTFKLDASAYYAIAWEDLV